FLAIGVGRSKDRVATTKSFRGNTAAATEDSKETPSKPSWPSGLVGLDRPHVPRKSVPRTALGSKRCDGEFTTPAPRRQTGFSYAGKCFRRATQQRRGPGAAVSRNQSWRHEKVSRKECRDLHSSSRSLNCNPSESSCVAKTSFRVFRGPS